MLYHIINWVLECSITSLIESFNVLISICLVLLYIGLMIWHSGLMNFNYLQLSPWKFSTESYSQVASNHCQLVYLRKSMSKLTMLGNNACLLYFWSFFRSNTRSDFFFFFHYIGSFSTNCVYIFILLFPFLARMHRKNGQFASLKESPGSSNWDSTESFHQDGTSHSETVWVSSLVALQI